MMVKFASLRITSYNVCYTKLLRFLKAASAGNADAQVNLGFIYFNGTGAVKSVPEAIKWFTLAAASDSAVAQNNLAYIYEKVV